MRSLPTTTVEIKKVKKNSIWMALCALYLLSVNVLALTEQALIQKVLINHKLFESDEIDMLIQQRRLESRERDYYGWRLDLTAKYGIEKDSTDKDTSYTYTRNQTDRNIRLKLSTAFKNGSSFSVDFDRKLPIDEQEKYKSGVYYQDKKLSERNNVLTTKINIPLLKNSDGGSSKALYDLAEIDQKVEILELLENKEDEVADALTAFIDLAIGIQRLHIYKDRLSAFKKIKAYVKQRKNDSKLLATQIQKTKTSIAQSESNLASSILTLKTFIDFNKSDLSTINFNADIRCVLIENSQEYLQKHSRDLQISKLDIGKKQRYIDAYKNKGLADLDINLSHIKTQNKGNYSSYSYKNANEYKISLDLSYPLSGNPINDYNLFKSKLEKSKKQTDYEIDLKDKVLDAKVLKNDLKIGSQTLDSYYKEKLKQQQITVELDNYLSGDGNIRFVLDEIYEHYQTQLDYLLVLKTYHQKRIEYDNLLDRLVKSNACYLCDNDKSLIPR
ncbi:MAG: hypothetical protein DSY43_03040 [Gammaproteobacteria bacterium]|nr:MAG: hypothetical protein DSY43_03040 [Gammaproteobacteria bacterium]